MAINHSLFKLDLNIILWILSLLGSLMGSIIGGLKGLFELTNSLVTVLGKKKPKTIYDHLKEYSRLNNKLIDKLKEIDNYLLISRDFVRNIAISVSVKYLVILIFPILLSLIFSRWLFNFYIWIH